ncbi:MAG: PEP-CTERM sorting domain-containing protein [Armatimonadetes bacterium]|nr:PEP-CTERM sorting domain-containing protein [Armatimonadota bacterium]
MSEPAALAVVAAGLAFAVSRRCRR